MKKEKGKMTRRKATKKVVKKNIPHSFLTKEEFLMETKKISVLLRELKSEMNEKFEKHENIILAEYRHRIETLEMKVRELQTKS
jgi:hypothetical protein